MPNLGNVSKIISGLAKSATDDFGKFVAEKPGLFSKLESVVNEANFSKMDAAQLRSMLGNKQVSPVEIENTLGGLRGTVTKPQVMEEVAGKGIKLEDVVLKEQKPFSMQEENRLFELSNQQREFNTAEMQEYDRLYGLANTAENMKPKFSSYQEPGAVEGSYREMFVTAPSKVASEFHDKAIKGLNELMEYRKYNDLTAYEDKIKKIMIAEEHGIDPDKFDKYISGMIDADEAAGIRSWKDGHSAYSDIQNPIVRIRYNDREVDGKKILFVEEMQGPAGDTKYVIPLSPGDNSKWVTSPFDTKGAAETYAKEHNIDLSRISKSVEGEQGKMPPHLQSRIYDIGVKRVLAKAKEEGYDGVAWTTGEMQAERYDLSKQVDRIIHYKTGEDKYHVFVYAKGDTALSTRPQFGKQEISLKEVEDFVGKEIAQKIAKGEGEATENGIKLSGLDLKVGGEGLKSVYDKTLPEKFKKYGKGEVGKVGISTIKETMIDTPGGVNLTSKVEDVPVHYIPIKKETPSRYPIYSALPPLLAAGLGAEQYQLGREDVKGNRTARMRW